MKPTTLEWIDKPEGDFLTAQMSYRARKNTSLDAACFHAQQCADANLGIIQFPRSDNLSVRTESVQDSSLGAI